MRLHTKTAPTNVGMFSKKVAFLFDFQLQLIPEEAALVQKYQYGDSTVGTIEDDDGKSTAVYMSVNQAVAGKKGMCFQGIGPATRFESSLIEGCKRLANNLDELRRINAGGERVFDITADGVQLVSPSPKMNAAAPQSPPVLS